MDVNVVSRQAIETHFSPTAFDDLEMGVSDEKIVLPDVEKEKFISPPTPPVSERPTRPPALLRSFPFETRIENVPVYDFRKMFY